jgi:hypothetical protein
MTNDEKFEYRDLKTWAKNVGVLLAQEDLTDAGFKYNGITIAYAPMTSRDDCRMLGVSVSYCAPEDRFKKKKGKLEALRKMYNNEYVQVPLANVPNVGADLLGMFTVS